MTRRDDHRRRQHRAGLRASASVFVPLSTVAFATLPGHLRTEGTAILTLVRNIGSSIGIPMVIAQLTSMATAHARPSRRIVTPFNNATEDAGRGVNP